MKSIPAIVRSGDPWKEKQAFPFAGRDKSFREKRGGWVKKKDSSSFSIEQDSPPSSFSSTPPAEKGERGKKKIGQESLPAALLSYSFQRREKKSKTIPTF